MARKGFEKFCKGVRDRIGTALTIAAEGRKADIAKQMKVLGPGVMETALHHQANACRAMYVTEIAGELWVWHAFQRKSQSVIKTPKLEVNLIRGPLKGLGKELPP